MSFNVAGLIAERDALQKKLEAAEAERDALKARIEEAEKQIPTTLTVTLDGKTYPVNGDCKLYAAPIPSPDTQDLIRKAEDAMLNMVSDLWGGNYPEDFDKELNKLIRYRSTKEK